MKFLTLNIGLFFGLLWLLRVKSEPDWTMEILEINCTNNTPDLLDINIDLKRIARGRFVVAGTVVVGADLTDETKHRANLLYSQTGHNYVRTPFTIPEIPISQYFNTFYKDLFLDTMLECSTNLPINDKSETFTPPWRKSVIVLENCNVSNAGMPSHMRSGYYKLIFEFFNEVDSTMIAMGRIEPK